VPSRDGIAAEEGTPLANKRTELHRGVAPNTRAWRLTALIRRNERFQNRIGKLLLKVLNMKRDTKMISNATRIIGGIKGAATLAVTVALIGCVVKSHPHTDHFMACLNQECGGNRRVNAT
jgi:hypothetical protein